MGQGGCASEVSDADVLRAVIETQSITEAAKRLGRSRQAIHDRVNRLIERGFIRRPGWKLTASGKWKVES